MLQCYTHRRSYLSNPSYQVDQSDIKLITAFMRVYNSINRFYAFS